MNNTKLHILIILLFFSCNYKKQDFFSFFKENKIPLKHDSMYLFLPNSSCSYCVNQVLEELRKKSTPKISILFLDNNIISSINKNGLKTLKNTTIYYLNEREVKKYFPFLTETINPIFTLKYQNNKFKISTFRPSQINLLIKKIKNYEK